MAEIEKRATTPQNKNELILYRLDSIDKKLIDLQVLVTQTALQEKRIADLEASTKSYGELSTSVLMLKQDMKELKEHKKSSEAKWWQILLLILSPIVGAIMTYALAGGFKG